MLLSKLSRCSQSHSRAYSQVYSLLHSMAHSQHAWLYAPKSARNTLTALNHTPEHSLKYSPNSTRWHTPSLLDYMLPSNLSRGKTLPILLDYMLPCAHLHAWSRGLLSCRSQPPGGVRQVAYGGQCLAGGTWHVLCGRWRAENDGRIMTSVDIIVSSLSSARPPWEVLTMPHGHGVDNWSLRIPKKGRQFELGESRSPIQIFQLNLFPASHWLFSYLCASGLRLMEMMVMAMPMAMAMAILMAMVMVMAIAMVMAMAMVMVLVIVIRVLEVLWQVGWLHQCQHQSFHRLWALYWPKLQQIYSLLLARA